MTQKYHFIGIGGAGMSVVAELMLAQGNVVSGSDREVSAVLERIADLGIDAYAPHQPQRVPAEAIIVVSSAIRESNPELVLAKSRGQQVIHRSEALALASSSKRFVAVAGAHGKTTSSGMIFQALASCGLEPSCAIGGTVINFNQKAPSGAHLGSGSVFVAEADESDGSFLNYRPEVVLVTNIEADHLDHFGSIEAFEDIFFQFAERIVPGGVLICCAEDAGASRLAQRASQELPEIRVWTYGRKQQLAPRDAGQNFPDSQSLLKTVTSDGIRLPRLASVVSGPFVIEMDSALTELSFEQGGDRQLLKLQVTGEHNLLNAIGAWTVGIALGVSGEQMAWGLGNFSGTGRRFELKGVVNGRRVYDDYAHHPTEVAAALKQARVVANGARVIVVFQPHLYTRTVNFAREFAEVLQLADAVVLADIYAAREDPLAGVTSKIIANYFELEESAKVEVASGFSVQEAARRGASLTKPGDVLLLVGAGDIFHGSSDVLSYWRELDEESVS